MRERDIGRDEEGRYPVLDLMALGVRAREYLEACQEGKKLGGEWQFLLEDMNRFFESALRGAGVVKSLQLSAASVRDLQAWRWSQAIEAKRAKDRQVPRRDLETEVLPQYQSVTKLLLEGREEIDSTLVGEMREFFTTMFKGTGEILAKPTDRVSINGFGDDRLPTTEQKEQNWLNRNIFEPAFSV